MPLNTTHYEQVPLELVIKLIQEELQRKIVIEKLPESGKNAVKAIPQGAPKPSVAVSPALSNEETAKR